MSSRRKYDRSEILQAYRQGWPYQKITSKFGVSYGHLLYILKDAGIKPDQARVRDNDGFRKLVRAGKSKTRILSIPTRTLTELGVNLNSDLQGKWVVNGKQLTLEIRES